ncbi:Ig-like domain-containing protein [Saccharibacillus sp. JS10]|uniref:Ig-like domain-containing protein n=1 Tax=Saccharibacillus sp. JS10 TaxID=2950552 RepID=UPI002109D933|nr:Ig-like domain-containing protein [Saccharibacillus sp. JS10]MCQ4088910.1 Ig-like domain-containing protein [Saccharibacillus sp. JS10]
MNKQLKLFLIRVLCVVLVIGTFPGMGARSYAAEQKINYERLGTHDFEFKYASFVESPLYIGSSPASNATGLMHAFAKYNIPNGFPTNGNKAVLSLKINQLDNDGNGNFPSVLQIWMYKGSTDFDPVSGQTDPSLWHTTMSALRNDSNFELIDTKYQTEIYDAFNNNGGVLAFDVDASVKAKAGSKLQLLITGPEGSSNSNINRFEVTEAPYLTEVTAAAPASANQSTVSASSPTAIANGTASSTITVTVKDSSNNLLSGKTVTLSKGASNSVISPASQITDASGVATFTVTNTKAETAIYTASVAADSVTITQQANVTFQPGAIDASRSTVTANPTSLPADNSSTSTITVTLKDATNNVISGKLVTLGQGSGSSTITATQSTTDASGVATFTVNDSKAEAVTYTAMSNGVTLSTTPTVTFQAGAVSAISSTITASKPSVLANNTDSATITVLLKDANGNVVPSTAVTLSQGSGSSSLGTNPATTNPSGIATFNVRSTKAESVTYTATANGTTIAQTVNVTFQPGAVSASASQVTVSKNSVLADGSDSSNVTVKLTDAYNNPISGKNVTLSQGSASSNITPANAVTNSNGQVIFTVKSTKAETVTYTATDATDSLTLTQSGAVTFIAGAVSTNNSSVASSRLTVNANNSDSATITVTLKDTNNNLISGKSVTLSGDKTSTITSIQGTTDANGTATFSVKSTKAEKVTYTATASGVTIAETVQVTFQPGAVNATTSKVEVSKSNVSSDNVDSSTITVTLTDVNSNPISGKNVTLSQGSGSSTITPSSGVTTDANGQALFVVTSYKKETVTYTAKDATDNLTLTNTGTVTFDAGAIDAALSNVTISKTAVAADNLDEATITVTLRDKNNNVISGKAVTLSQGSGSSTITATQGTTDANGVATFTVKSTKAESVIYTATSGAVTLTLHPVPATFTPGEVDATTSTVTSSKPTASANGLDTANITVTLKDSYSNVISNREVTLSQGSGSSLIAPTKAKTNIDGVANFTVSNTATENVFYTASVADANITISQTASVNFLNANANLSSAALSVGELVPIFTPMQTSYFASVDDYISGVTVALTAANPDAKIEVNDEFAGNGIASKSVLLQTGNNVITIKVTAADGITTKTYTIQVTRKPNQDASLSSLTASPVDLKPTFDSGVTSYKVNVPYNIEQYEIKAKTANALSTLTVTGAVYDANTEAYVTDLKVGSQTINFEITAQDGLTSVTYAVEVIRASVQEEVKNALNNLKIGYTGTDSWEFVSQDLILPTTQDGLPVIWSTNQPQLVSPTGIVSRPINNEASVILTASIVENGVEMSRTFLVIVKPQGLSITNSSVTRNVPIRIGDSATDIEQTPITRKTLSDGTKIDKVVAEASQLSSALQAAITNNQDKVRVVVTDLPADPSDEVTIDVPAPSYAPLVGQADLDLETDYAHVQLDKATLTDLQNDGQSLFFRFVPIRQAGQKEAVTEQALSDSRVKSLQSSNTVSQIGTPMTIETNYSGYNTTLLFPADKLNLPAGSLSQQAAYASSLYVYIQHSDGTIALQRGTVQYDANGQIEGIAIQISKFSTFTILAAQPITPPASGGNSGNGGSASGGTGYPAPTNPGGSTPTPTPTPVDPAKTGKHQAYVKGYTNGTFRPSQTTTRAEFAAMLWRVMQANGAQATTASASNYTDVPRNHWAYDAISQLQAQQIILGVSADRFAPNRPLTRGEFATLAVRWQKLSPTGTSQVTFTDTQNHWAAQSIAILAQTGVVKGYTNGTFRPDDGVTRAELVTMMNRLLKRGPLSSVTQPTWTDVPKAYWAFGDIEEASRTHTYEVLSNGAEKWISE